jgi:hypothetical protein
LFKYSKDIRAKFEEKTSEELSEIWVRADKNEYTEEAFDAIKDILIERGAMHQVEIVKENAEGRLKADVILPKKVKINKVISQILGWLLLVPCFIMAFIFFVLGNITGETNKILASGDPNLIVGIYALIIFIILGVLLIITANGIANQKKWAKIMNNILAFILLFFFPFGTFFGVWMLINFFSNDAKVWFEENRQ